MKRRFRFDVTPEEAQPCALHLARYIVRAKRHVTIEEAAWPEARYRTTIFSRAGDETILYEVQGEIDFHNQLRDFAQWLAANRRYAELWIVADGKAKTTAAVLGTLKKSGVGLLLRDDETDKFDPMLAAVNPALQVTPDPALRFGDSKTEISACVEKFNRGDRKDALRDLFELVERDTEKALIAAAKKAWISVPQAAIEKQDWSTQINTLGSANVTVGNRVALIDGKLKDDMQSFRGARNLLDHKVRSRKEEQRRQCQMAERMMMGTRLMSELIALRRRIH